MSFTINNKTGGTSGGNFTINAPTNANGDQLVALAIQDQQDSLVDMAPPAGWNLYSSHGPLGASKYKIFIWTKTASSEPASYNFTCPATDSAAMMILGISGASGSIEVNSGYTDAASSTSSTAGSLTPLGPGRLVVCLYTVHNIVSTSTATTPPTQQDGTVFFASAQGNSEHLALSTFVQAGSGATSSQVATWSPTGGETTGIQLALPPTAQASSPASVSIVGNVIASSALHPGDKTAPFAGLVR